MLSAETVRLLVRCRESTTVRTSQWMSGTCIRVLWAFIDKICGRCLQGLELHVTDRYQFVQLVSTRVRRYVTTLCSGPGVCEEMRAESEGVLQRFLLYRDILCNSKWDGGWIE
jgi:hypothetical protein